MGWMGWMGWMVAKLTRELNLADSALNLPAPVELSICSGSGQLPCCQLAGSQSGAKAAKPQEGHTGLMQ